MRWPGECDGLTCDRQSRQTRLIIWYGACDAMQCLSVRLHHNFFASRLAQAHRSPWLDLVLCASTTCQSAEVSRRPALDRAVPRHSRARVSSRGLGSSFCVCHFFQPLSTLRILRFQTPIRSLQTGSTTPHKVAYQPASPADQARHVCAQPISFPGPAPPTCGPDGASSSLAPGRPSADS